MTPAERTGGQRHRRARLYDQVRTAHLERAANLPPATILYAHQRYDFDPQLARGLDLVQVRGWRAIGWFARHRLDTLEINEPLMLPAAFATSAALLGLALSRLRGAPRTIVVTYAIENLDPFRLRERRWRTRLKSFLQRRLTRIIWRRVDRIVFGTAAAQDLYAEVLPKREVETRLTWALPARATDTAVAKTADQVLFLGAFSERKGLPLLAEAWPRVLAARPTARLIVIGMGVLQSVAENLATLDTVTLRIDPDRAFIRSALAESQIVVLPSQPTARWREQVGLPIVEGLAYGCTIVTTGETGLARWLADHGHRVIASHEPAAGLAEALLGALADPLDPEHVLSTLPERDGRLAADDWMFR